MIHWLEKSENPVAFAETALEFHKSWGDSSKAHAAHAFPNQEKTMPHDSRLGLNLDVEFPATAHREVD